MVHIVWQRQVKSENKMIAIYSSKAVAEAAIKKMPVHEQVASFVQSEPVRAN